MRVLLVVHGYPPAAWGGTEVYTRDLARALLVAGDEVVVLAREADPTRGERTVRREVRDGVSVVWLNRTFRDAARYEDLYRDAGVRRRFGELLDEVRPDLAHMQHLTGLSTDLLSELAERRIPSVLTLHDYWMICQRGQLLDLDGRRCEGPHRGCRRCADAVSGLGTGVGRLAPLVRRLLAWLPEGQRARLVRLVSTSDPGAATAARDARVAHTRAVLAEASLLLAPSRTVERRFLDFGVAPERLRTVPLGIDLGRFAGLRKRPESTPSSPLRLGYLGSLMLSKAPHLLLEAFTGLPSGAATLDVYGAITAYHGDDRYRAVLAPLLATPGVRHHGPIAHEAVPAALAELDVLVVPSIWLENAPLVVREAFAAGVPVVAADLGGMAESVEDGVDGLLFRPGDAADLGRVLHRLLDEPDLLPRLRAGIRPVRGLDEHVAELRELYRDVEATRPSAAAPRRLAAVVLCHETPDEAVLAVRSLASSRRPVDRLVVVDNGSAPAVAAALRARLPGVEVLATGRNLGFSGGVNAGLERVLGGDGPVADAVFVLNADAMVTPDTLGRLEAAAATGFPIVAPVLLSAAEPSSVESAGIRWSPLWARMRHPEAGRRRETESTGVRRVDGASGCALWIERQALDAVGRFDEAYFFSFEDLDLCLRAGAAGLATGIAESAVVFHHGSRSIGVASPRRLYFASRNHLRLASLRAPLALPLAIVRAGVILALNLAYALRRPSRRAVAVAAVLRGAFDHFRGRYGPDAPGAR